MHAIPFLTEAHHEISTSETRDFGQHEQVTPARDESAARRAIDAYRLSFPLTLVLIIGSTVAGIVGTYAALSARMSVQDQEISTLKSQLTESIDALRRQQALEAVRVDETRVIVAEIKGFMTATGMKETKK